ncbi:MAG: c-type cytochrome [Parachlamydiaceae bacterium]|nr:c-type cytochrome [Parachlamydiaceae bacterium]
MHARADRYQIALIILGLVAAVMFGVFLYRELFPEYKIYQNDYIALEKFRSTYTGEPPPAFEKGVKQIVIEREDRGPPVIDRCISCHVALQFPHFSPTKIAYDINGNIVRDEQGIPKQVENEEYIWLKLDQKIAALRDEQVHTQLREQGKNSEVKARLQQVTEWEALKTAKVGHAEYDVEKVLVMHPLIGKETRPFEFHSLEEYGCVSCHNGNGRGLTTEKAHGPVYDGQYHEEFMGPEPHFLESDADNDPKFAHAFNHKPGEELLFQTYPLFVGSLIEAKCVQCHQPSSQALQGSLYSTEVVTKQAQKRFNAIQNAFENERQETISLLNLKKDLKNLGLKATQEMLLKQSQNYTLPPKQMEAASNQLLFISKVSKDKQNLVEDRINQLLALMLGNAAIVQQLEKVLESKDLSSANLDQFLKEHQSDPAAAKGTLFVKFATWNLQQELIQHVKDTSTSLQDAVLDDTFMSSVTSDIDLLTKSYQHGQQLYLSQACYACHRIAGLARGGVGPELTKEGKTYPWFIKESIVWPQSDLKTSTMPNYKLDHEELQDLMTFLLGQTGESKAVATATHKTALQDWEAGRKMPWEKSITPVQMKDVKYAMTVFATEGCSACHRLKGFESNVGFSVEKENSDFNAIHNERQWFTQLFPEGVLGSQLVTTVQENKAEIDKRIVDDVRQGSLLEEIERTHPGQIEALYSNFKYAMRAQNHHFEQLIKAEKEDQKRAALTDELKQWKERINRLLMMYIQEYGLGRLVGPKPNWSGIFRTDEWLMEHFRTPTSHVPNSIMPVFPFDDTKFYALTHMLDVLGIRNRDAVREIWKNEGFNPEIAYETYCSQCHGESLSGNGAVAEWIYPIPKNLRNADFLRNLTKAEAIQSITHGVKGTPMPPWGEVATDKISDGIPVLSAAEIRQLVDWLYSGLAGESGGLQPNVPKWKYQPEDILKELEQEGNRLKPFPEQKSSSPLSALLPSGEGYYAALTPTVSKKEKSPVTLEDIFDVVPNSPASTEKNAYYIKKQYYTPENIEKGREFFEINCAICHGKEADGTGLRSEVMKDAKPRMLTNLDWINTRDDLRLLRSIKYGVPGTSMTPWGDFTSMLQRMQLVIFIRTLSQGHYLRDTISGALYKAFDRTQLDIENARVQEYTKLAKLDEEYNSIKSQGQQAYRLLREGKEKSETAEKLYLQELALLTTIQQRTVIDDLFTQLKRQVVEEANLYKDTGMRLLVRNKDPEVIQEYAKLIMLNGNHFVTREGKLIKNPAPNQAEIDVLEKNILDNLDKEIAILEHQKSRLEGQLSSASRLEELATLTADVNGWTKLKNTFISNLEAAERLVQSENETYDRLQEKLK